MKKHLEPIDNTSDHTDPSVSRPIDDQAADNPWTEPVQTDEQLQAQTKVAQSTQALPEPILPEPEAASPAAQSNQQLPQPILPEPEIEDLKKPRSTLNWTIRVVSAIVIVGSGLVIGVFIGALANFCMKDCTPDPAAESLIIVAPLVSLAVTAPIAYLLVKK